MRRVVLRRETGPREARARGGGEDARFRSAQARREGLCQGRPRLLAGEPNADNTRTYAFRLDDIHGRLEGVRRPRTQRLRSLPRVPPRERVRARQEPCQRHRELLVVREGQAREVQRLRFRQICATLERVRVAVQPQARGLAAANQEVVSLYEFFLKILVKHLKNYVKKTKK